MRCDTCGFYDWQYKPLFGPNAGVHQCPPKWIVWRVKDWEDRHAIHGSDPAEAVQFWAQRDDCGSAEYSIVNGDAVIVRIIPFDDRILMTYNFSFKEEDREKQRESFERFAAFPEPEIFQQFEVVGESVPTYWASEIKPQ